MIPPSPSPSVLWWAYSISFFLYSRRFTYSIPCLFLHLLYSKPLSSRLTTVSCYSLLASILLIPHFFFIFTLLLLYSHNHYSTLRWVPPPNPFPTTASSSPPPLSDVRLRVRAEYLEHESALRGGVSSDKQQPLERQFELFSQANSLLRARDLGSIVCDIKFTELDNLEAFWGDYLSGALLEALKGVFITDSLRMAAGSEGVRLLISVDQDDYEEGRRLLRARKMLSSINGEYTGDTLGCVG